MRLNIHRALGSSPSNQVRWLRPVIPTIRRYGQEDQRFKATLFYVMSVMPKLPETFSQRMAWGGAITSNAYTYVSHVQKSFCEFYVFIHVFFTPTCVAGVAVTKA